MLAPLAMRPIWTPLVAVGLEILFFYLIRAGREHNRPRCLLALFITTRILFWSAVAMLCVLLVQHHLPYSDRVAMGINHDIPFVPVLIVAPLGAIMCLWMLRRGTRFPFCVDCKLRFDTPAERGFLGMIYSQEGTTQVRVLMAGCALLAVSEWIYYIVKYANDSLNAADRYFFFAIPAALWVIAAIYMSLRYLGISRYYDQNLQDSLQRRGTSTRLRFLIVGRNRLLVSEPDDNVADSVVDLSRTRADTPAEISLPFRENVPLHEAEAYLDGILPVGKPRVRFLYSNTEWNVDCNIFHYMVNVDDETAERLTECVKGARWLSIRDFNHMLAQHLLDPLLASEIHRVYTMSMAFKTYDERGRRRYPIRHYHPTFRLCDVMDYHVDFNDRLWLYVARCNQDEPFYRLRSFWRRYINGLTY